MKTESLIKFNLLNKCCHLLTTHTLKRRFLECALAIIVQIIKLYINYGIIKHAGGEGARRALIFRILIVCEGAAASTGQGGGPRRAPLCFLRHCFLCNIILFNFVKCFGVMCEKSGSRKRDTEVRTP